MFSKKTLEKINSLSSSFAEARKKNILIHALPSNISRNIDLVKQIRSFAEAKLKWHPIGFKIGATKTEFII